MHIVQSIVSKLNTNFFRTLPRFTYSISRLMVVFYTVGIHGRICRLSDHQISSLDLNLL